MLDSAESTTATQPPKAAEPFPIRFSASYASRYNNCHGSANLEEAIPGFEHPDRNERGMKGEGTILHKIFQDVLEQCQDILEAANLLEQLAALNWRKRRPILADEKQYIIWWFMQFKQAPPVDWSIVNTLQYETVAEAEGKEVRTWWSVPPRRIVFLAEALRQVFDIIDTMEGAEILTEVKLKAEWLTTRPSTTADLVLRDKNKIRIIDLKMGDVVVSPIFNEQLMYYAKTWRAELYDDIQLWILQRGGIDYWELTHDVLNAWVERVKASEDAILDGDLTLNPGSHCTFCPANPHGRGDRGSKSCPAMLQMLYGERDAAKSDEDVLEGDDFDE